MADICVTMLPLSPALRVVIARRQHWPPVPLAMKTSLYTSLMVSGVLSCQAVVQGPHEAHAMVCVALSAAAHHAQPICAMPSSWPRGGHGTPVSPKIAGGTSCSWTLQLLGLWAWISPFWLNIELMKDTNVCYYWLLYCNKTNQKTEYQQNK